MKISLPALAVALLLASPALAHPGGHGGGPPTPSPAPEATPAESIVPDTYAEVVTALRDNVALAEKAVEAARIVDLHRSCEALSELGAAVPDKIGVLPPEAQATARTTAAHLEQQVAELVSRADKGDAPGAKAALAALVKDLDVLEGLAK